MSKAASANREVRFILPCCPELERCSAYTTERAGVPFEAQPALYRPRRRLQTTRPGRGRKVSITGSGRASGPGEGLRDLVVQLRALAAHQDPGSVPTDEERIYRWTAELSSGTRSSSEASIGSGPKRRSFVPINSGLPPMESGWTAMLTCVAFVRSSNVRRRTPSREKPSLSEASRPKGSQPPC